MASRILLAVGLALVAGCGDDGGKPDIVYRPHTVLDIPVEGDIADPHVVKDGGTWYLYATSSKEDLDVWLSEDLAFWRDGGRVWERTPGTWNAEREVWAPHVERAPDGWYLYYSAATQVGVAFAETPLGPFEDLYDHPLVGGGYGGVGDGVFRGYPLDWDEYAIDAFVLAAEDGSLTLYTTAYDPSSYLIAQPMVDHRTLADAPPTRVLTPDQDWERPVVEGPWVIEHEGTFHLTYSGNLADGPDYALAVAVGPTPLGPFDKDPDPRLLRANPAASFFGPGHHSVVEGARGDLLLFYHTQMSAERGWNRRIRYVPVSFGVDGRIRLEVPPP